MTLDAFDVFLCHNSEDKPEIRKIAKHLAKQGIKVWLDINEIRPGSSWQTALEKQITSIKSVAVFVGKSGIGPWQDQEIKAFLNQFVKHECPVIPVILESAIETPVLPIFLSNLHFVDFRISNPNPLLQLLWGITGKKTVLSQRQVKSTNMASISSFGRSVSPEKDKLRLKIEEQLKSPMLQPFVNKYLDKLVEARQVVNREYNSVAEYLVEGQNEGDLRRNPILMFLEVAESCPTNANEIESLYILFSYLLQTLVRKCQDTQDNGFTRLPVNRIGTVELINAARTSTPIIPRYAEENLEHKNGQRGLRDGRLEYLGFYLPETGIVDDVEAVCRSIAKEILISLGESADGHYSDPFELLEGRLSRYDLTPEKAPIHGFYLHEQYAEANPLGISRVAAILTKRTYNRLQVYIYGTSKQDSVEDWIHTKEERIRGLIVENNKIVESYNLQLFAEKSMPKSSKHKAEKNPKMNNQDINIGHIAAGATININTGTQSHSQVGQGNIQLTGPETAQLLQHLAKLRADADQSDDVSKQAYKVITKAADDIENQITRGSTARKTVLTNAKDVLDGFKNIAGIADSIEKITKFLLPFLS